jgi:hypothetical protein
MGTYEIYIWTYLIIEILINQIKKLEGIWGTF